MRAVAFVVLLAACGGGSSSAPAKEPAIEQTAPLEAEAPVGTGAEECDGLIARTDCLYEKSGARMPPEAQKAWSDGVEAWTAALANDATRQSTIDACRMSLDAGYEGFASLDCWQVGDAIDGYVPPQTYAAAVGERDYTFVSTGNAVCDSLITKTLCMYERAGEDVPDEAYQAFRDGIASWTETLQKDATRQATIDACKLSLNFGQDGYEAAGC